MLFEMQGCLKENQVQFKRGIELNPGLADLYNACATILLAVGRIDEAIVQTRRAIQLDPLSIWLRFFRGLCLVSKHQFDQAIDLVLKDMELAPDDPLLLDVLVAGYAGKGMYDKAILRLKAFSQVPLFAAHLGWHHAKMGKEKEARSILNGFLDQSDRGYLSPYLIAGIYAGLEEKDKVFEYLDKAYEVHDPIQWLIKYYYWFTDLHSDPKWKEQLEKRGLAD